MKKSENLKIIARQALAYGDGERDTLQVLIKDLADATIALIDYQRASERYAPDIKEDRDGLGAIKERINGIKSKFVKLSGDMEIFATIKGFDFHEKSDNRLERIATKMIEDDIVANAKKEQKITGGMKMAKKKAEKDCENC